MAKRQTYESRFNKLSSAARQETIDLMLAENVHSIDLSGHDIHILCPVRGSDGLYALQKLTKVWIEPNSLGQYGLMWESNSDETFVDDRWYVGDKIYLDILEGVYRHFGKYLQTFKANKW